MIIRICGKNTHIYVDKSLKWISRRQSKVKGIANTLSFDGLKIKYKQNF